MAEKFYPTRHTTLGAVMDAGLAIHAFCFECGFDQEIDLERVAGELGREQSVLQVYLVPKPGPAQMPRSNGRPAATKAPNSDI